jgi:hypothetical protein
LGKFDESESILREVMDDSLQCDMHGIYLEALYNQAVINYFRGDNEMVSFLINDISEKTEQAGMIELGMLVMQLQMIIAGRLGQFDKVDDFQQKLSAFSVNSGTPWPHIKIMPYWLAYNHNSGIERSDNITLLQESIIKIEEQAQSEEISASFQTAKNRWLVGITR